MSEEGVARHDPTQPPSIDRTQARALFVNLADVATSADDVARRLRGLVGESREVSARADEVHSQSRASGLTHGPRHDSLRLLEPDGAFVTTRSWPPWRAGF